MTKFSNEIISYFRILDRFIEIDVHSLLLVLRLILIRLFDKLTALDSQFLVVSSDFDRSHD